MDAINFSGLHNWSSADNAVALAGAIRHAASGDTAAAGLRAAAAVSARYEWKSVFARLFAVYREVIASYNP
jgi:glycosyltransferase involved in cell wall biosynthesis